MDVLEAKKLLEQESARQQMDKDAAEQLRQAERLVIETSRREQRDADLKITAKALRAFETTYTEPINKIDAEMVPILEKLYKITEERAAMTRQASEAGKSLQREANRLGLECSRLLMYPDLIWSAFGAGMTGSTNPLQLALSVIDRYFMRRDRLGSVPGIEQLGRLR